MESSKTLGFKANPQTHSDVIRVSHIIHDTEAMESFAQLVVSVIGAEKPLQLQATGLTADEIHAFNKFIIAQRVLCLESKCKMWNDLKKLSVLLLPEAAMDGIGQYLDRNRGYHHFVSLEEKFETPGYSIKDARETSLRLSYFEDILALRKDAMPRQVDGVPEVMSSAIFANRVKSIFEHKNEDAEFITVFLGMTADHEDHFRALCDDLDYIEGGLRSSSYIKR